MRVNPARFNRDMVICEGAYKRITVQTRLLEAVEGPVITRR